MKIAQVRAAAARVVKHSLTKRDNQTFDVVRVMWALGVNTYLVLSVLNWSSFDPATWGAGFGLVMGAGGLATVASDKLTDETSHVPTPTQPPGAPPP